MGDKSGSPTSRPGWLGAWWAPEAPWEGIHCGLEWWVYTAHAATASPFLAPTY